MSVNWADSVRIEKAKFSRALMNYQTLFRDKMNTTVITYMSVNWADFVRIEKAKFSRALMNYQTLFRDKMNTTVSTKLCLQIHYV